MTKKELIQAIGISIVVAVMSFFSATIRGIPGIVIGITAMMLVVMMGASMQAGENRRRKIHEQQEQRHLHAVR